jgi:hypothetical protein
MSSRLGPVGAIAGAVVVLALVVYVIEKPPIVPVDRSMITSGDLWFDGGACPSKVELHFRVTSNAPSIGDAPMLDRMADCLTSNKIERIDLGGLGVIDEPRAREIAQQLESRGVAEDRLSRVTYADGLPLCRPGNETCWSRNRRPADEISP